MIWPFKRKPLPPLTADEERFRRAFNAEAEAEDAALAQACVCAPSKNWEETMAEWKRCIVELDRLREIKRRQGIQNMSKSLIVALENDMKARGQK